MAQPRYKPLVDQLAADIRDGRLAPGTRLPTHRQLADEQGIALVTASRVYAELEQMGLVSGEIGRGTFVRETSLPPGHGIDQSANPDGMLDLNFNSPSMPGQTDLLRQALRKLTASGDLEALLHYQPHAGRRHERAIVASHLADRGLQVEPEQVLIVSGAQHGLATSVMAMLQPGDLVATDALIYPGFKVLAQVQRLELAPIPADRSDHLGMDLDALEQLCLSRRVRAVYTMPTLHNPLGWVMPLEQRQRLVELARRFELILIEDAAYAFHAEDPPPPLATLAPERTLYVSGLSKSIATGLRVGFVCAPTAWIPQLERVIRATTWNTPGLMTALGCRWIEDGTVTQLEAQKREDARQRQAMAREILQGLDVTGHPAAYFLWLNLPEEVRTDQLVSALMREQIAVSGAEPFAVGSPVPHAIRLALGSVSLQALEIALKRVRQLIDDQAYGLG
ncbi:PLP-dependent aminotransferase family protein [Motiliproteus coralliicola]|uniref:PLP-dependent aminotransferase family protein n=1 Tax=Motiliproteus coralliicola TaxID=2283196 RepID=A0A369WC03_9GAMM|nr:PLP-dependent aminotransferase family protein [Motiliproteus coralliicola]RDE18843.1 PLP-dependent aminotransferase family protein [Motiliproteus coralliicola]